jgi:hypothetical protein
MNITVHENDRDHVIERRVNTDNIESVITSPEGSIIWFVSGRMTTVQEPADFILPDEK